MDVGASWGTRMMVLGALSFSALAGDADRPSPLPRLPSEDRPLAERFAEPPASARILRILHKQQDVPDAQDKVLRQLVGQGFGGFAGNVSFDGYVDDETKWPPFLRGVALAKEAGLSLWLYDECGYPSGSARDLTLRGHPEWAARGLLVAETNVCAGASVSLALPPGRLVSAVALPRRDGRIVLSEAKDLSQAAAGGRVSWQVPDGEWFVVALTDDLLYEGTHAAVSLAFKKPCIDLLTPEPTARFIEVTHERYAAKLGKDLGKSFVATFTDEPSLQNLWMRPMPYRVLPWSLTLEREFKSRRGYALAPVLPALVADAGSAGAQARYDFWLTVGELVSDNYFGQLQRWCRKHGFQSGGHLLMEENVVGHVPLYGDFFRCARRLDAPSIDCLTSLPPDVPWFIARMIGSIADLEGRAVTMCEVSDHCQRYRPQGDPRPVRLVTEDEIRGTCNRLIWGGINTLTSYYAFKDLSDEQLRRLNEHVGRCQTMLRGGHQVTDIAVLYPIQSIWTKFVPAYHGATSEPGARRIESAFDGVSQSLYGANRDFAYVDAQALCDAKVKDDSLVHGDLRWRVLVLPAADTLPLEAWKKVLKFWRKGGVVIAVGARPSGSEKAQPSGEVLAIAEELFGRAEAPAVVTNKAGGTGVLLPTGMIALLPSVVDALVSRDVACADAKSPVKITHRRVDGHEVYFAINDSGLPWSGTLRFCGLGVSEQWDPSTGTRSLLGQGSAEVAASLGPYGAMLFRAPRIAAPQRLRGDASAGLRMTAEPLPAAKVSVGGGQHVRSELTGSDSAGWQAKAELAKGQVDTHQFVSFAYALPLDFSGSAGLALDTVVPEGQRTPVELLVFLHAKNGANYISGTGRYLNAAGEARAYVMFSQFRPFGDSKGPLDLSQVDAIRVGWGGYFGAEGERIAQTIRPPMRFVCGGPAR